MSELLCPRCAVALVSADVPSMPLSGCPSCGGLWASAQACAVLAREAPPEVAQRARELAEGAKRVHAGEDDPAIACPVCGAGMLRFRVDERALSLDRCAAHGTWFDAGELRQLAFLDASARAAALPFADGARPSNPWLRALGGAAGVVDVVFAIGKLFP